MPHSDDAKIPPPPKPRTSKLAWALAILIPVTIFVWMLLPAVSRVRDPAARMQASNNLATIGKGLYGYDGGVGKLPARAICDKEGKPLLSWRVTILPYMEEEKLYKQFKLDEPWDSPNNKSLIQNMPRFYHHPKSSGDRTKGLTHYKVLTGKNTLFDQPVLTKNEWLNRWSIAELEKSPRGTANLILCVESGDPVIWTKPEDIEYDPDQPLPDFKPMWVGQIMAVMGDGRVISVRKDFKESAMRASIDPNSTSKEIIDQ